VGEETEVVVGDVRHAEDVELRSASTTGSIDREEDRPCDEAADETNDDRDLEESQEQETVERLML